MSDKSFYPVGHLAGAEVGVQTTLDGQDIVLEHSKVGQRLACLLASGPGQVQVFRQGDVLYWRIPHSHEVDRLLVELADLFISIRYAHPTLVQLELALPAPGEAEGDEDGVQPRDPLTSTQITGSMKDFQYRSPISFAQHNGNLCATRV